MTKFIKNCSIIALCMIGVGIIVSIISGIGRGWTAIPVGELVYSATNGKVRMPDVFWDYHQLYVMDDDLGDIGDIGFLDEEDIQDILSVYDSISGERKTYDMGNGIRNLDIETGLCVMEFGKSEDDDFHVETVNMKNFKCYVKGDTLHLESTHHANHISDAVWKKQGVKLYVPEGAAFSDVDIEFGGGSLELGDLTADKLDLEIGAGWIGGQKVIADKLEISLGSGSAELKEMQVGEVSMDVGMGSLEFDGDIQKKADIECGMGSIVMELEGLEEDFNYEIESAMGSVEIGSHDYSGLAREKSINNGANKTIEVDCAMGSIEILFAK